MHRIVSENRACGTQNRQVVFTTGVGHSQRACAIKNTEFSDGLNSIAIALTAMFSLNASLCRNCFVATAENFAICEGSDD